MSRHYRPPMTVRDDVESLSDPYYRIIGEIIFQWNCVENSLRVAAKRMLGIGIKEARIAMRDPRPKDIFAMIEELALIHDQDLGDWTGFESKLETGENDKNVLCHARWIDIDGSPGVQFTTGTKKVANVGSYKRRHYPDALPVTGEWLDRVLDNAIACRELADRLGELTRQLAASRQASTQDIPQPDQPPVHNAEEGEPPPQ